MNIINVQVLLGRYGTGRRYLYRGHILQGFLFPSPYLNQESKSRYLLTKLCQGFDTLRFLLSITAGHYESKFNVSRAVLSSPHAAEL